MTIDIPGGPLATLQAQPTGDPIATVVLVPGFTGSKEDFRLVLAPLAAAGFRAVAYDQRGQFESPGPDDPAAFSVEALAADLLSLVEALDDGPVHVVGHSFGGLVSRAAALRQPAALRSLTLLASGPAGLRGPRTAVLEHLRPLLLSGGLPAIADVLDAVAAADPRRQFEPAEQRAFLRRRFLACSPTGLLAMADALMDEPDRVDGLRETRVPVLVTYGAADDAWHPDAQAAMADRLAAAVAVIPDAVHAPAAENPAALVGVLTDFFASLG